MQDTAHTPFQPETIGEELYLVHLRRRAGTETAEEDFDRVKPRKREHDVGEELWEVHLKRSRGREEEGDGEDAGYKKTKPTHNAVSSPPRQSKYNLRSKDVAKKNTA